MGVASRLRIVISEVVVEEPGLGIAILAGEPQVELTLGPSSRLLPLKTSDVEKDRGESQSDEYKTDDVPAPEAIEEEESAQEQNSNRAEKRGRPKRLSNQKTNYGVEDDVCCKRNQEIG